MRFCIKIFTIFVFWLVFIIASIDGAPARMRPFQRALFTGRPSHPAGWTNNSGGEQFGGNNWILWIIVGFQIQHF